MQENPTQEKPAIVRFDQVSYTYPEAEAPVFTGIDLDLPGGVVSFVGQNGTGKSTALLLASGRLIPDEGRVSLLNTPTSQLTDESERNRLASFVYQNMEFETDDPIGDLFAFVYENGFHKVKDRSFVSRLTEVFELEQSLHRRLQLLSKGEMQRAIVVFSLLYGSQTIMMDEPIFALEEYQKERALDFITSFARESGTPVYLSIHELDLSKKYADAGLLFYRDRRNPKLLPAEEAFSDERIEEAYQFPVAMLRQREYLFRERLTEVSKAIQDTSDDTP